MSEVLEERRDALSRAVEQYDALTAIIDSCVSKTYFGRSVLAEEFRISLESATHPLAEEAFDRFRDLFSLINEARTEIENSIHRYLSAEPGTEDYLNHPQAELGLLEQLDLIEKEVTGSDESTFNPDESNADATAIAVMDGKNKWVDLARDTIEQRKSQCQQQLLLGEHLQEEWQHQALCEIFLAIENHIKQNLLEDFSYMERTILRVMILNGLGYSEYSKETVKLTAGEDFNDDDYAKARPIVQSLVSRSPAIPFTYNSGHPAQQGVVVYTGKSTIDGLTDLIDKLLAPKS